MWAWLVALLGAAAPLLEKVVFRIMAAMGIAAVTYTGVQTMFTTIKSTVMAQFSGLPVEVIKAFSLIKADVCISMIFSAYAASLAISSVSGAVTRLRARPVAAS